MSNHKILKPLKVLKDAKKIGDGYYDEISKILVKEGKRLQKGWLEKGYIEEEGFCNITWDGQFVLKVEPKDGEVEIDFDDLDDGKKTKAKDSANKDELELFKDIIEVYKKRLRLKDITISPKNELVVVYKDGTSKSISGIDANSLISNIRDLETLVKGIY